MEVKGGKRFRNKFKGHMDKTKEGWDQGREVGMAGAGGKWRQLYLNNDNKQKLSTYKIITFILKKNKYKISQVSTNIKMI